MPRRGTAVPREDRSAVRPSKPRTPARGTPGMPWPNFGAEMAVHGRVGHVSCLMCDRLESFAPVSESFLIAFGMTSEDMVDGV